MKKTILILSSLIIASSLFAAAPQFSLNAQSEGLLFHGFTTVSYANSDELLTAQSSIEENATIKGLDLTINKEQKIGHYAFYSTNLEQTSISFKMAPLSATVINDIYYVPYTLNYTAGISNHKITLGDGSIKAKKVASKIYPGSTTELVLTTDENSTGLRYQTLNLSVEFEGTQNISFGLPEVNGEDNYYTGTITALIDAK